jgi:hypothetical protein
MNCMHVNSTGRIGRGYLKAEEAVFDAVRTEVTQRLPEEDPLPVNRYFEGSPIYPGHFKQDWNRSYILEPDGDPAGAVVFLHGLTDSPYSLRHIAGVYRGSRLVSVAIRLPAHGTVPGALTEIEWEDWMAATSCGARSAAACRPRKTFAICGFFHGGALALKYALDALDDERWNGPTASSSFLHDRNHEFRPFCRASRSSRIFSSVCEGCMAEHFAGVQSLQVQLVSINGAWQSHRLTQALQQQIANGARDELLGFLRS